MSYYTIGLREEMTPVAGLWDDIKGVARGTWDGFKLLMVALIVIGIAIIVK